MRRSVDLLERFVRAPGRRGTQGRAIFLALSVAVALLTTPAPAATRIDLNQNWVFRTDPDNTGEASGWAKGAPSDTEAVAIPHSWNIGKHRAYLGNAWYFRYFPHDGITKTAATEFALNELGRKKVGILYVANEYGQSGRDIIVETLRKHGLAPVAAESHNATDKDMSGQLLRVKQAGADVIISQAHPADTALILKQQRQLGIDIPHVASSAASQPASPGEDHELSGDCEVEGSTSHSETMR